MATTVFNQSEGCCPVRDHNGPSTRLSSSVHSAHVTSSTDCAAGPLKIPFLQMRNQGSGRSQSPPTGSEGLAEEPGSSNFPRGKPSFLPGWPQGSLGFHGKFYMPTGNAEKIQKQPMSMAIRGWDGEVGSGPEGDLPFFFHCFIF